MLRQDDRLGAGVADHVNYGYAVYVQHGDDWMQRVDQRVRCDWRAVEVLRVPHGGDVRSAEATGYVQGTAQIQVRAHRSADSGGGCHRVR